MGVGYTSPEREAETRNYGKGISLEGLRDTWGHLLPMTDLHISVMEPQRFSSTKPTGADEVSRAHEMWKKALFFPTRSC